MRIYTEEETCRTQATIRDHWFGGSVENLYNMPPGEAMQRIEAASQNMEHFAMKNFVPVEPYEEMQWELSELMDEHRHRRS